MDDSLIIELFRERDEKAIAELKQEIIILQTISTSSDI